MRVEFLADPENKTSIRNLWTVNDQTVRCVRRNEHKIARSYAISMLADLHANVTFYEEIELKIVVRMGFYFCKVFVIIVVKLEVTGKHILSGFKGGL